MNRLKMEDIDLVNIGTCKWEAQATGKMRVPVRIYASEKMLAHLRRERAAVQAVNVACLPGIVGASLAMPDIHWGYGFPIGGVAAFGTEGGIVSPGGVGYDINCGVRLMVCGLDEAWIRPRVSKLLTEIFSRVPTGVGSEGAVRMNEAELKRVAESGARWAVSKGFGTEDDIEFIEEKGRMEGAEPRAVSERAWKRGLPQMGTLGSGNHFLEIGYVSQVYDTAVAASFGLHAGVVTVLIHTGSRGFGHQICDDYVRLMDRAVGKYGLDLPDRQLACAPIVSPEGRSYIGAMKCAANYAFANRQVISQSLRDAFELVFGRSADARLRTVYDIAHNIAKQEEHSVEGSKKTVWVHRKGATRAFGPGRAEVPVSYRNVGQPVLIPGDMGRCSYVLVGTQKAMEETFGSACHGAGRMMSRHEAVRAAARRDIAAELRENGIEVMARGRETLAEEMPAAYKDVSEVVDVCAKAGIAAKVVQIRPLGCVKG